MNKKLFGLLVAMYALVFAFPMTVGATDVDVVEAVRAAELNEEDFVMPEDVKVLDDAVNINNSEYDGEAALIQWDGMSGDNVLGYIIYRYEYDFEAESVREDNVSYWIVNDERPHEFRDTGVETGKVYVYAIVAMYGEGNTITHISSVDECSISRELLILEKPEFTLSNASKGVKITWNKVDGADGYIVYRKKSGQEWELDEDGFLVPYKFIENADKTSYINTAITAGQGYYYQVTAYMDDPADSEYFWETDYGTGTYIRRLSRPSVTVSNSITSVKVSWKGIKGANGYEIYRDGKLVGTTSKKYWYDKKISDGSTYTYTVKAYYKGGSGVKYYSLSSYKDTITRVGRAEIASLKAGKKAFTVKYDKVSKATGYQITYSKDKNFNKAYSKRVTTASTTVSNLTKGKTYYVKVRAYKTVDGVKYYGMYSKVKKITVK